jgi:hypothetical protein
MDDLPAFKDSFRYKLYPGEDEFFRTNTGVAGMAAEDDRIILNPYAKLSSGEFDAVARNEYARIAMRRLGLSPPGATPAQKKSFAGTAYGNNDEALAQTIIARILSGDPSSGDATPEQQSFADELKKRLF